MLNAGAIELEAAICWLLGQESITVAKMVSRVVDVGEDSVFTQ